MKKSIFRISHVFVLVLLFISSCSLQKRKYTPGFYSHWHGSSQKQSPVFIKKKAIGSNPHILASKEVHKHEDKETQVSAALPTAELQPDVSLHSQPAFKQIPFPGDSCDVIVLKSGIRIKAKVKELALDAIKYKKCGFEDGPIYVVSKKDVAEIEYSNGTKESIEYSSSDKSSTQQSQTQNSSTRGNDGHKKVEGLGIAGFVLSLVGLIVAGIPLGTLGIIFGAVSLNKINKQPEKYQNRKGYAYWSIALGVLAIIGAIIAISLM